VKGWGGASGPAVARLFHRLLALIFLDAWLSLGSQVKVLYGEKGLLPIADYLAQAKLFEAPSLFFINSSDHMLIAVCSAGMALSVLALFWQPRACHGINTLLYLSFAAVGHSFMQFQWDNLLLECGFFAMFLPRRRPSRLIHMLFRLILFKLYFESGIAKWQSHLHDWQDGSAMVYYYETAPLPAHLAWYAHHLPVWWHHLESWATLGFELVLPFFFFGPRKVRLYTCAFVTFFQIVNAATANYGFFVYLALCLHVFLVDDSDIPGKKLPDIELEGRRRDLSRAVGLLMLILFSFVSLWDAVLNFGPREWVAKLAGFHEYWEPFRLVNTYHLFGHITRERIEPQLEVSTDGTSFKEYYLKWKPGPVDRAPRTVAPHQPRVDFQMWFYGLSFQFRQPDYVINLLDRACNDPDVIDPLFTERLPAKPAAVQLSFWRYHFTTPEERRQTGAFFRREKLVVTRPIPCDARTE
jgi:hypothetical protein